MLSLDFDRWHEDGRLSDKGYYLAKGALMEILFHSRSKPISVWLYRNHQGEISHFWKDPSNIGTEVTGPAEAPYMALSDDGRHIWPRKKPDEVKDFLIGLGLDETEAQILVTHFKAP